MDERLRFVARLLEGEKMAVLCREFDISRKTGYKIFERYKDCGVAAFSDRSTYTRARDNNAELSSNDGFSVVAPISRIVPPSRRAPTTTSAGAPCAPPCRSLPNLNR